QIQNNNSIRSMLVSQRGIAPLGRECVHHCLAGRSSRRLDKEWRGGPIRPFRRSN
ncbi:hypothetical protein PIB30_089864, partial [Stylosanthes scabra]|nr:hypothetical protein [Stylosanthes scabra]